MLSLRMIMTQEEDQRKLTRRLPGFARCGGSELQVFEMLGEPGKNRTCDPLIKSQLLYRLSYGLSQERRNLVFDSAPVNAGIRLNSGCDALACRTAKPPPNMGWE